MKTQRIFIAGQQITLRTTAEPEQVERVTSLVETFLNRAQQQGANSTNALILTAIYLAEALLREQKAREQLQQEAEAEAVNLQQTIDQLSAVEPKAEIDLEMAGRSRLIPT